VCVSDADQREKKERPVVGLSVVVSWVDGSSK
jgi:hypothetical protein